MRPNARSRQRVLFLPLALAFLGTFFILQSSAHSEDSSDAVSSFSRLTIKPLRVTFKTLNFNRTAPVSEVGKFVIENTGRGTSSLVANIGAVSGTGASSFRFSPALPTTTGPLMPGAQATVVITFQPLADGRAGATILVTTSSSGVRGATSRTVHLVGVARGPIPTPTMTPIPTATPTAPMMTPTPTPTNVGSSTPTPTPTPTITPTLTPTATPTPSGAVAKNSANAPGVIINGQSVTVTVPLGSDDNSTEFAYQVPVEGPPTATPLPTPDQLSTDRVNSCTPAQSGEIICSGQDGTVDLIPPTGQTPPPTILQLSASQLPAINYMTGDCIGCGMLVDDAMNLGIWATSLGFIPVDLIHGAFGTPIAVNGTNSTEVPGIDFGYDKANHRILSANYQLIGGAVDNPSPPEFQIIDISNPASPLIYEFAEAPGFFNNNGRTCATNTFNDTLPETTALDTSTNIAYVTFHTPPGCFNAPPDDIAMFDLSRVIFNNTTHTWDIPVGASLIQSISGTGINGIDPISVDASSHLALVSSSDNNFGVLALPTASGVGANLAISDWVNALMPNSPDETPWAGWHQPGGLTTYVSPNTGKVMGVLMNNPSASGVYYGSTYLALIDMQGLLNPALRDPSPGNGHKVNNTVDLVGSGLVTFVQIR
jgi:hypothetical protein